MEATKMRAVLFVASFLAIVAATSAARADEDPADALIRRGAELRKTDRHEDALELFRKAHALSPSGRTLAQMGLAEFSLKRYVEAEAHLTAGIATDSPWVARNRAPLEEALGGVRTHIAVVSVSGPAGVDVTVNGKPVGRLPLPEPLHVAEGAVRFEATAPEHQPSTLDVTVAGGREFKVSLDPAPRPPLPLAPSPSPTLLSAPVGHPEEASALNWKRWVGGSLLAVSAAALATGIVWLAVDNQGTCDVPAGAPTGAKCMHVYDTKAQGWIAFGVGIAAGVGGGVLLWKGRQTDVALGLGPGTLHAFGSF